MGFFGKQKPPAGVANLAALFNNMDTKGAEEFAARLNEATPADVKDLTNELNTATPERVQELADELNAGRPASPAVPIEKHEPSAPTPLPRIHFSCNSCHEKLRAKAEFSGKQLRCPKCGQVVKVPRPTVRATCPACGKTSGFSADDTDKKGRCPACKVAFPIRVHLAQPAAPGEQSSSRPSVSPSPPRPTPTVPARSAEELRLVAQLDALEEELQKKQAERDRRWFERMQRLRQGGTPAGVDFLTGGMIDHVDLKSDVERIEDTVRALEQLGTADALQRVAAYRARKKS